MFTTVDNKSKSVIRKNDLRELLFKFMLPIGKQEFSKLWAMYAQCCSKDTSQEHAALLLFCSRNRRFDAEGKGCINYSDFLTRLTGEQFAPGDWHGTSDKIIAGSYAGLEKHHREQQAKHEQNTVNQAFASVTMDVTDILQQLKYAPAA